MGLETRTITDRVTKQIFTIFSKTYDKCCFCFIANDKEPLILIERICPLISLSG